MITLKTLRWNNCFSYGPNNELDLNSSTLTQIIGTNGMGKSSIPLIIEEALFNKNSKGIKKADISNRHINEGYDIYLSFSVDEKLYEITINRKSSVKVRLEEDGEDISSHTATNTFKTVQEIIGIDFRTFSQLVYQNTNSSLQFLTATDTQRKKFLIDLLHLEEYVNLFEVFKKAARDVSIEVTAVESKLATVEKWLNDNKLKDTSILPLENFEINTETEEKELSSLMAELKNISEKNKKIIQNNQYKDLLNKVDIDKAHKIEATQILSYDDLQSEGGQLVAAINNSKKVLEKLSNLKGKCPTCEQTIEENFKQHLIDEESEKVDKATQKLENEIKPEISKIKENNRLYQSKVAIQKEWEDLYKSVDKDLPSKTLDKKELEDSIKQLQATIQDARNRMDAIAAENEKRTKRNTRIQVILEQTEKFKEELDKASKELNTLSILSSNLEVLKKAFSTNGLLAYKIENLVKELEELVNSYLAELSDGRFTLEFVVSNDKLNVVITDNANTVDILALSSGELARVNTATLLAIRKLMSSISKSRLNILFLDEVINVLDEAGREKLVEVLLQEDLNTYIVSHGWTHPLLEKIEVVKSKNISMLEK